MLQPYFMVLKPSNQGVGQLSEGLGSCLQATEYFFKKHNALYNSEPRGEQAASALRSAADWVWRLGPYGGSGPLWRLGAPGPSDTGSRHRGHCPR